MTFLPTFQYLPFPPEEIKKYPRRKSQILPKYHLILPKYRLILPKYRLIPPKYYFSPTWRIIIVQLFIGELTIRGEQDLAVLPLCHFEVTDLCAWLYKRSLPMSWR